MPSSRPTPLSSITEFASLLGISKDLLLTLAYSADHLYKCFRIRKRGSGYRSIAAPCKRLKGIQRWICYFVLRAPDISVAATGFRTGVSVIQNAEPHVGSAWLYNVDIEDFFPSITGRRVYGLFRSLGYVPGVASALAGLTTYKGRLPQGAPSSPSISNLLCRRMDKRFLGLARKLNLRYTRYADDLSFSSAQLGRPPVRAIEEIVRTEGFKLNPRKSRVLRRGVAQTVTGLVVNDRVSVARRVRHRIRAMVFQATRKGTIRSDSVLQGHIAFLGMVNSDYREVATYRRGNSVVVP